MPAMPFYTYFVAVLQNGESGGKSIFAVLTKFVLTSTAVFNPLIVLSFFKYSFIGHKSRKECFQFISALGKVTMRDTANDLVNYPRDAQSEFLMQI